MGGRNLEFHSRKDAPHTLQHGLDAEQFAQLQVHACDRLQYLQYSFAQE